MSFYTLPKGSRDEKIDNSRRKRKKFEGNQFVDSSGNKLLDTANSSFEGKPFEKISKSNVCYRIIEFNSVFLPLSEMLICGTCKSKVTFDKTELQGLGFKITVKCRCPQRQIKSGPMIGNGYEVNRRFTLTMRLLAVGGEGINIFCNIMDIGKGFATNTYSSINK